MKKIIVLILFGFLLMSHVVFAIDSTVSLNTTTETGKSTNSVLVEKYVTIPFKKIIKVVDEFRLTLAEEFQKKSEAYKAKKHVILENSENVGKKVEQSIKDDTLKETQDYVNSDAGNPISLIWITILIYVFTFLAYTFATAYIFYTIAGLAVFLILRFIWTYLL